MLSYNLQSFQPRILIYPNPAADRIYFNVPEAAEGSRMKIEIFDASGRLVDSLITHDNNMDVSSFSTGIYYIQEQLGSKVYHSKLLINP